MKMSYNKFRKKLVIHGADIQNWPEEIRSYGLKALESSPELRKLVKEEKNFEEILQNRKYEEPGKNFAGRIALAACSERRMIQSNPVRFFSAMLREFRISRFAFTTVFVFFIATLIAGYTIGVSASINDVSADQYETGLEDFLNDEGSLL